MAVYIGGRWKNMSSKRPHNDNINDDVAYVHKHTAFN
jgi:hypothetical protein